VLARLWDQRGCQRRIQFPIKRVNLIVGFYPLRVRTRATRHLDRRFTGRFHAGILSRAHRRQQRRAVGRPLGGVDRHQFAAEHIRQYLPPERAFGPAAGDAHLGNFAQTGRFHQLETVAQAEGHALQHGAGHVRQAMPHRQPDKGAARQRVGVRGALAGQVRQEEQAICAGGVRSRSEQLVEPQVPGQRYRDTSAKIQPPRA
jgi:hypothetical protein